MSGTPDVPLAPPAGDIHRLAEHLFRHEAGKLVSVLTGLFGLERLQLAEDVVQEALIRALQTWPYYGIPRNPAAWLTQTAKNLALDVLRREALFLNKTPEILTAIERWSGSPGDTAAPRLEGELQDDRLRLMFACCHPLLPAEAQTALALKTLCGFSPAEIARAFLSTEAAIAKRLVRARQAIRDHGIPFEVPAGAELDRRLDAVLHTLYLLFNEGYKASSGENLVRADLCAEAIRLASLLAGQPGTAQPRTHALLALMLLNAARLPARTDPDGHPLRLRDQDRAAWDKPMLARGFMHLAQSADGGDVTAYHLQAGIAACHAAAPDYDSTDWRRILALYDRLAELDPSPIVALNRAVAVAQVEGPQAGLEAIATIRDQDALVNYHLLYAVQAEFEAQLGNLARAAAHLRKAILLTDVKSEQAFLSQRLRECEDHSPGSPGRALDPNR